MFIKYSKYKIRLYLPDLFGERELELNTHGKTRGTVNRGTMNSYVLLYKLNKIVSSAVVHNIE